MIEGLTSITLNGQEHELYFGMHAVEAFSTELEQIEEASVFGINELALLVYAGLINAAILERRKSLLTFKEVFIAVEGLFYTDKGQSELVKVSEAFKESKAVKYFAEKAAELSTDTSKKKKRSTGTK